MNCLLACYFIPLMKTLQGVINKPMSLRGIKTSSGKPEPEPDDLGAVCIVYFLLIVFHLFLESKSFKLHQPKSLANKLKTTHPLQTLAF